MAVTVLGFGGAEVGFGEAEQQIVDKLLNSALDAGLNVVDTAECYKNSEGLIGNAIGHRRGEFFLFTKCGHASGLEGTDWEPKMLEASIERSLSRLKTDCVDLVQLHSCSLEVLKSGSVIEVLQRAKEAGKTRYIGYSGDNEDALYAIESGAFDALQTSCNIADQHSIELLLPKAKAAGMGIIAKRPIANVAWKSEPPVDSYPRPYWDRLQELKYPFLSDPLDEAVSKALRFTLAQEGLCTAIVGTMNPDRWVSNAKLLEVGELSAAEVKAIRSRWLEIAKPDWLGKQ